MPTKRKRIRRKKTLRGGIPFIGTKTRAENINNCKNYWSRGKDPSNCEKKADEIDYPGKARKLARALPTYKSGLPMPYEGW